MVSSIRVVGNTPSKLWSANNTWTDLDCSGPVDQPNSCASPNIPNQYFALYNYRIGFGYDSKGQSFMNDLHLTFVHNHPGGRQGISAQFQLDPKNPGKVNIPVRGMPSGMGDVMAYAHTGRDGRIYLVNRASGYILRFDPPSAASPQGKWTKIAGAGGLGTCEDTDINGNPTLATACRMDIQDVYVTANSDIYFVDRGRIRTITDTGSVATLFGQGYSYGDSKLAIAARFGKLRTIDQFVGSDGKTEVIALDPLESRMRSFKIGESIQTVVGNGLNASISTARTMTDPAQSILTTQVSSLYDGFTVDSTTGDIYLGQSAKVVRLNRSTNVGKAEMIVGGGSNKYNLFASDGKSGTQISYSVANGSVFLPLVFGFGNGQVLTAVSGQENGTARAFEAYFKLYDSTRSFAQTTLAGSPTPSSGLCASNTSLSNCNVNTATHSPFARATYVPASGIDKAYWLILNTAGGSRVIRKITVDNTPMSGAISVFTTATNTMSSFAYREIAAVGSTPAKKVIYYCSTDGRLYSRVASPATAAADTQLPWTVGNMSCTGGSLLYNASRNSLIFPATQNQMSLIMEYLLSN
jgi:hypothetical protein